MAQPPLLVDAVQIEPGSTGTRLIERDSSTNSLKFTDALITSGVLLRSLVGIRNITGVFVVGRAGDGAMYTSIQDALDAIPDSSDATAPSIVLIFPGVYDESVTIEKDGVFLVGLAGATLSNPAASATDTVTVQEGASTTPLTVTLKDLTITNAENAQACIRVIGADGSTVCSDALRVLDCTLIQSGVGGWQIHADTVNNVEVRGGTWAGSASTSVVLARQCASFSVSQVAWANRFEFAYDSTDDVPSVAGCTLDIRHVGRLSHVLSNLEGEGSLVIVSCPEVGNVTQGGDRTVTITHCKVSVITADDTTAFTLVETPRTTASGTGSLSESRLNGTVTFSSASSAAVTFEVAQPDTSYTVLVDSPTLGSIPQVTARTTTGFTLTAGSAFSGVVRYSVVR